MIVKLGKKFNRHLAEIIHLKLTVVFTMCLQQSIKL